MKILLHNPSFYITVWFFAIGLYLVSCDDILEPDISKKVIKLLVPVDSTTIKKADITLRWEELPGASSYRLQIASPSFTRPDQYFNDTLVTNLSVRLSLQPGKYEWRVQGLNSGYETGFSVRSFQLDSTSNLSGSEIRLLNPATHYSSNSQSILFSWDPVELADKYIFEIVSPIKFDSVVYETSLKKTFPKETKTYEWKVQALNNTGIVTSAKRSFVLDFEAPTEPHILYPKADTTVQTWPVTLKWRRTAGDVVSDSLYLFASNQIKSVSGFPKKLTNSAYEFSVSAPLSPDTYYWAVKSFDRAGNASSQTTKRKITVR